MDTEVEVQVVVNGERRSATVPARTNLADFLRDHLGLTGTHVGCEHGVCGACTVLVDGVSVRSCILLAASANGANIETVESLGTETQMHPLQQAFQDHHGLQCGFCTPGFLMTLTEVLRERKDLADEELREAVSGNLCRCTGYQGIMAAARQADRTWDRATTADEVDKS